MTRNVLVWLVLGGLLGVQVMAHHAVGSVYDEGQTVTIEGTIGVLVIRQPHPLVHLAVDGREGRDRTWAIELDGVEPPPAPGATWSSLRPGDRITVCGNPGRDPGDYRVRMLALQRSDGLTVRSSVSLADTQCAG